MTDHRYGLHSLHVLFENGHQEGTAQAITHGRTTIVFTGLECTDCGLRISWKNFVRLDVTWPDGTSGGLPMGDCPADAEPR